MYNRHFKIFILLVIAAILCSCSATSAKTEKDLPGKPAPLTRFTMLDGTQQSMDEYRGKTTVIAFWSTWCAKSFKKLRKMSAFAGRYGGRGNVAFLAVSIDKADKLEDVKERIAYGKMDNFKHAFSGNDISDEAYISFCGGNVPYFVVVGPQGEVLVASYEDEDVYKALGVDPAGISEVNEP